MRRKHFDDLDDLPRRNLGVVVARFQCSHDVGCVSLPDSVFDLARKRFVGMHAGSVFHGVRSAVGITVQDLLEAETAELAAHTAEPPAAAH